MFWGVTGQKVGGVKRSVAGGSTGSHTSIGWSVPYNTIAYQTVPYHTKKVPYHTSIIVAVEGKSD